MMTFHCPRYYIGEEWWIAYNERNIVMVMGWWWWWCRRRQGGGNITSAIRHRANPNERCELCWRRYCLHLSLPRSSLSSIHPSISIFVYISFHQRQGKCLFPLQVGENTGALSFGTIIHCLFAAEHHHHSIHTICLLGYIAIPPTFISPMSALPFSICSLMGVLNWRSIGKKWDIKIRAVVVVVVVAPAAPAPAAPTPAAGRRRVVSSVYTYIQQQQPFSWINTKQRWCPAKRKRIWMRCFGRRGCVQPDKKHLDLQY